MTLTETTLRKWYLRLLVAGLAAVVLIVVADRLPWWI